MKDVMAISVLTLLLLVAALLVVSVKSVNETVQEEVARTEEKLNQPKAENTCSTYLADLEKKQPEKFSVTPLEAEAELAAKPDFSTNQAAALFRTRIGEALAAGPNFAGHYVVASWGCGTMCQEHAVLDALTGAIVSYGEIVSNVGISYTLDSNVIVTNNEVAVAELNPAQDETLLGIMQITPRQYYLLTPAAHEQPARVQEVCVENSLVGVN